MSKSQVGKNIEHEVPLLSLRDLRVGFGTSLVDATSSQVLCGVDLDISAGQSVALIGDSGCGKSMTARAVCGLLPGEAHWSGGIFWRGQRLEDPTGSTWQGIRGSGIGLVLQEPTQCLNPVITVGRQIAETIKLHKSISDADAWKEAINLLAEVQLSNPSMHADFYPHQLSGGMCQRVLIAATLACSPDLLIADEPTTSLDPTVQREILLLLNEIITLRGMALLFITHDYDLVPVLARKVARMQEGRIISFEDTDGFSGSIVSSASIGEKKETAATDAPVLVARNLNVTFGHKGGNDVHAVRSLDMELFRGQALGLAGESGCGKTTLARMISGHLQPTEGTVTLQGERDFYGLKGSDWRQTRRKVQLMFQNAAGSLNPRQATGSSLREAADRQPYSVEEALLEVGLDTSLQWRYPHELSGGQRQRVALARALACNPDVLVADEPTTALDPQNRTRVLDLLSGIMKNRRLALLVISHDLQVLHRLCTRVAIMIGGYVVEVYRPNGDTGFRHPYGQELWSAQPRFWSDESGKVFGRRSERKSTKGSNVKGCPYSSDCPLCKSLCSKSLPELILSPAGDSLRCPEVGL